MKALKRFGTMLVTLLSLAVVLTGTALAAEPGDGGISVQLNGKPVALTNAAPESFDGRTFVPLRAVLEAMDAQVDYNAGAVDIHRGGVDLSMILGQNTATVTEDGQTRTITMDVAPYVKNDRTYVPVRFVAEAFGCNVGWDNHTRTVIIADIDALFGDATFDLMDSFAAYCDKQDAGNMTLTGALALDIADSSGGMLVKPVSVKGSLDGVTSTKGLQMDWTLSMSDLSSLLGEDAGNPIVQGVAAALSDLKGEVRMDMEKTMVYLTLPAALTGAQQDTWYSLDLGAYQTQLFSSLDTPRLTQLKGVGTHESLTAVLQSIPLDDSQTSYNALAQVASVYVDMLSDQSFTQKGNNYVAEMKLEDVVNVAVTLTKKDDDIVAMDIKMDCTVAEDSQKMVMTMTEYAAPDKVAVDMNMEVVSDGISVKLDLDLNGAPTQKVPVTAPPSGATVIPLS